MHKPIDIEYCLKVAIGLIASPIPPRHRQKPISLANYDVSFVNNAVRSINAGDGLSDRQRELSIKLVQKYTRQYKKLGIDVTDIVVNPVFSSNIRQVDRTKLVDVTDDTIYVKFPYSKQLITQFKALGKKLRATKNEWVKESKMYEIDYNEFNLLKIYNWSKNHKFKYTDSVVNLVTQFEDIIDNREKYAIQLVVTNSGCHLNNAPSMLQSWWDDNMTGASIKKQIVAAANQNIDVVNRSTTTKLSSIANRVLKDRGGRLLNDEYTLSEIVQCAKELEFNRVAYIVDSRHLAESSHDEIKQAIQDLGADKCSILVKHLTNNFNASTRLQDKTEFAILDSAQRYSHHKSGTTWRPDFIISPNTLTKFRNVFNDQGSSYTPWICYRAVYHDNFNVDIE